MKRSFKNISNYLQYKTTCPFCYHDLGLDVISSLAGQHIIDGAELKNDGLHYILQTFMDGNYETFKITLRLDGKLSYNRASSQPSSPTHRVDKRRFIDSFNFSYAQISQACVNRNCRLEYFKESLPLYLDEKGLHSPELYRESFIFDKYLIQNNYADDAMEVYIKDNPSPPVKTRFYELTDKSAPFIFDRIKMALVFS